MILIAIWNALNFYYYYNMFEEKNTTQHNLSSYINQTKRNVFKYISKNTREYVNKLFVTYYLTLFGFVVQQSQCVFLRAYNWQMKTDSPAYFTWNLWLKSLKDPICITNFFQDKDIRNSFPVCCRSITCFSDMDDKWDMRKFHLKKNLFVHLKHLLSE